jgi:hypothetical protein
MHGRTPGIQAVLAMKIRITSDGTPGHTYVENAETGERIENVRRVSWSAQANQEAVAVVELVRVKVSLDAVLADGEEGQSGSL